MTVRCLCILILLAGCRGADAPVPMDDAPNERPNIVVILVDDLRFDEIGVAGHPYLKTPHIDRLAAGGAWFENAFTTTPLCSPARASLLTGQYAHVHGITDNLARNEQSHRLATFPKRLNEAGYDTAFIGKWHMGNDDSPRPGFNTWAALRGQGEAVNPVLNIDGERREFDGYVTDILTDLAIDFLQKSRKVPFVLYLSHKALHPNITQLDDGSTTASPSGIPGFIAAERHRGMYTEQAVARRPSAGIAPIDKPALMRSIGVLPPLSAATMTADETIHQRHEMLMAVDDGVGEIMQTLDALEISDDTIVVFTSDHGYWYGEHGLGAERRLAYEEGARIPLIIRYPNKVDAGRRPSQLALSIDIAPTMIEFAGGEVEDFRNGMSLIPLLDGDVSGWRRSFLIEYFSDTVFERIDRMGYKAVRTERHKYIQYQDLDGMHELYDLEADPYELENLIEDPDVSELLEELQLELARHIADVPID